MASRKTQPKGKGDGVIDLSNDADWQSRLDEARARRAEVLREQGREDAPAKPRLKPWEEAEAQKTANVNADEAPDEGVDFHDRMNRFKKLAGVKTPRERSEAELEKIDALLSGVSRQPLRTESAASAAENLILEPEESSEEATDEIILTNEPPNDLDEDRRSTPTSLIVSRVEDAIDPADERSFRDAATQSMFDRPKHALRRFIGVKILGRMLLVIFLGFTAGATYVTFGDALRGYSTAAW